MMKNPNFEDLGFQCIGKSYKKTNEKTKSRRFKCFFGESPKIVSILWEKLSKSGWFDFTPTKKSKGCSLAYGAIFSKMLQC